MTFTQSPMLPAQATAQEKPLVSDHDPSVQPFYTAEMLCLQAANNTAPLAERLRETRVRTGFVPADVELIEAARVFFLATCDGEGNPDVSVKAGMPGYVRVKDNRLIFPDYDGNGMFRSLGNILTNPAVALLFLEFEGLKRKLRIRGNAEMLDPTDDWTAVFPGAQSIIAVSPIAIFPNCPRYLPTLSYVEDSVHSPRPDYVPPEPAWKSKPDLKDYVPAKHTR